MTQKTTGAQRASYCTWCTIPPTHSGALFTIPPIYTVHKEGENQGPRVDVWNLVNATGTYAQRTQQQIGCWGLHAYDKKDECEDFARNCDNYSLWLTDYVFYSYSVAQNTVHIKNKSRVDTDAVWFWCNRQTKCISDNITVIKNEIKWIATFPAKLNAEVQVVIYNNMHLIEQPYLLWCDLLASRILAAFVWENWGVGKLLLECWHRRDSCVCLCVYIYTCIYIKKYIYTYIYMGVCWRLAKNKSKSDPC